MKVLVTGRAIPHQPDRCTAQQLVLGFQEAGHDAVFYGNFYGQPQKFLGLEETFESKFDLIVATEMNDGLAGFEGLYNHYRLKDVPRCYWDFDVSYNSESAFARATAAPYDFYLVANKLWLREFELLGKPVLHLPYAFSPSIHKPEIYDKEAPASKVKPYLLGFVGTITPERQGLIETLSKIVDPAQFVCRQSIFGDDLVKLTSQMAIMFHKNQDACTGLVPGRPWETIGCATTLLMDRVSYNDFIEFLPEGLHDCLLVYDTMDDIRRHIAYYKDKKSTLFLNGLALRSYGLQQHTYRHRAEAILEFCK